MANEIRNDVGLDVPARVGMSEMDIETPALVVDLDAFECNLKKMRSITEANNVKLRAHAKAHKSAGVAHQQIGLLAARKVFAAKRCLRLKHW